MINKKFVNVQGVPNSQVNVLGPNQSTFLEFNVFNSATGAISANMTDTLPAGLVGDTAFTPVITDYAGTVNGNGCGPGTISVTAGAVSFSGLNVPNIPAAGTNPDCRVVVKVKGDPAGVGNVSTNVTNTVPGAATSATGPGGPYNSDPFSATVQVQPIIPANVSKGFSPATVPVNGNSVLTFTITNNAGYVLHGASLSDTLPATVVPQAGTASSSCGGTATISGQTVSLAGGTISANGSCTVTVTVKGTVGGTYTNNIPGASLTTTEGVTNSGPASAPLTVVDNLTIAKFHNYSGGVFLTQGQSFLVQLRFTNYSGALTNSTFTDNLPAGIVLASTISTTTGCGGPITNNGVPGASTITFSNFTVPGANLTTGEAGACDIFFMATLTASSGVITNTVNPGNITNTQGKVPDGPATATVNASPAPGPSGGPGGGNWGSMNIFKDFVNSGASNISTADLNTRFWMRMGAWNPGYDWQFTNGSMTDTLPVGVLVDVPGGAGAITLTPGTNVTYFDNPSGNNQGPSSTTATNYSGCANTGVVTVNRVAVGPDFQDTITYSGWTTKAMSANGTTTPAFYSSGCWFSIALTGNSAGAYNSSAPAPVSPIKPINTIPISNVVTTQGVTNPASATAPISILSPVGVKKTFNSYVLGAAGGRTRLTVELSNKSAVPQTAAALTDTLPTGGGWTLVVATPPNASTTCTPGTVTAVAGSGTLSIAGATIPAGTVAIPGTCTFSADIQVTGPAGSNIDNVIPPGALTTSVPGLTNVLEARAIVYTRDRNIALNKVFGNGGAAQGGTPVPMTITLTGDSWPFNAVGFSDNLISIQPGLVVAPNPNASTTCRQVDLVTPPYPWTPVVGISYQSATPATVTAVAGSTSISLANAYLVGSEGEGAMPGNFNSCTLTVDVVASTTGNKTNTIPASNIVTRETATNTAPTSATLTVQPNTQLNKAFTPSTISAGSPFTLTLTIFNVNTSPQAGFFITDTLPVGVIADSIASNTCGGTAVITGGGTVVDLPAAGTSVAANASCAITVNVHATGTGSFTNNQNNINASAIINKTTTTTVVVTAPTTFDLAIAKAIDPTTPAPYFPGVSTVKYNLVATNNGPGPSQEQIVVKDCLPTGLSFNAAAGTGWTCSNTVGPLTRGALTCSNEIVCTRNAGTGTIASGASASTITVTANVTGAASGSLVNYAQVNPAAGETLIETNLLGTTNGGYETGSPTAGSNNDDSKSISVSAVYALGNRVWFDTNNNGILDGAESPAANVKVQLLDNTGAPVAGQTVLTDSSGYYRFDTLQAGDYSVLITPDNWTGITGSLPVGTPGGALLVLSGSTPLAGYLSSTGVTGTTSGTTSTNNNDKGIDPGSAAAYTANGVRSGVVTLGSSNQPTATDVDAGATGAGANAPSGDASDNLTVDFGFYKLTVGNEVFIDVANNGVKDGADVGVDGVRVELLKNGVVVATTTTAGGGLYTFTQGTDAAGVGNGQPLVPGADYQVRLPGAGIPAGYSSSTDIASTANPTAVGNGVNSDDNGKVVGVTIISDNFTLQAGTTSPPGAAVTNAAAAITGNPTIDFGLAPSYSLGNRVWFDTNNDGILNNGESVAAGVKVQLLDSAGAAIAGQTVLTDANGYYRFDGLAANTYAVQITPDNWTGLSGTLPVGTTAGATAAAAGTPLAGYQSSTAVTGVTTGTGSTNNNDKGIDPVGTYAAAGVKSGNVVLGPSNQPTAEVDAGAAGAGLNGTSGDAFDNLTVDFGFYRLTVGDTVWLDNGAGVTANYNNGIKDAGEPAIQGVTVQLLKGATVVAVTTTDANGNYIFTQKTNGAGVGTGEPLVAGADYTINIPAGQTALAGTKSSATPASQPAVNSVDKITLDDGDKGLGIASADSTATASAAFTLGVSSTGASANANNTYGRAQTNVDNGTSHKPDMDFGFVPSFALGNRVWYDTNNNGVIDAAEQPINGVLVELTNSAGAKLYRTSPTDNTPTTTVTAGLAIEQSTANGGYYLFDNLPAGTFRVRVAASNWGSGQPLAGYANSSGATNAGAAFAAADNNRDHGTDPTGTPAQQAAAYTASGVSSADILLGSSTVGTGDTTETGATIGTPPTSAAGNVNDNLTIDFGFYRLSVGNLVWSDSGSGGGVYNDGIRNGTEPGLDGVTVQLVDSNGNVVAQTLTSGGGNYSFNQLTSVPAVGTAGTPNGQPILPGNYTINIPPNQTPIAGATSSADTAGGRTNADSQDNGVGIALTTAATTSTAVALTPGATAIGSTPNQVNGTTDQPRMDFGFAPGFAIGNRVWYDTNNNGVLDAGEVTVPNVLVELLDGNGVVIQTKATSPTGEYIFESLGTGNYTVRVAKENWIGITAGQVTAAGNPAGLAAGQKPLAGYNNSTGAGALTGTTTTDATDKGVDAADPTVAGISSAVITLGAGLQPLNESATGDNDGVGTTTSIDANNNMTIDFGFYKLTVGDLVWKDDGNAGATPANINNGLFDSGEAGISGVRVELYKGSTLVAVTTTDGSGNYLFTQGTDGTGVANGKPLVPGTDYQVRIPQATASVNTPLINLLSSAAAAASETTPLGVNSDDSGVGTAAASAGITPSVNFTLGAGTASGANSSPTNATGTTAQPNVDFGFAPSYSLGNRVWVDTNNNGIIDGAEAGLIGVTVTLLDGAGTPVPGVATQTTDASGYYRFDNLPAGNYRVEIAPPPVNGVNYVSSTGQNASATGPYEAGLTSAATGTNNKDHGTQATPTTIRSGVVAVGPTALINGEVDAGAANAGANGPNGDAFDVLTVDFGIFLPAKLGNLVWFDVNKNGTADPAEPGLNNVSVILRDLNGVEIARQVTRTNPDTGNPGYYQFDYLIPGQYRVEFSAPGYFGTTPGLPSITSGTGPDTNNSQIQPGRDLGTTQLVTLAPGDNNPQLDAGYIVPPVEVPTLSELMKLLLAMMMLSIGVIAVRTRQQ